MKRTKDLLDTLFFPFLYRKQEYNENEQNFMKMRIDPMKSRLIREYSFNS